MLLFRSNSFECMHGEQSFREKMSSKQMFALNLRSANDKKHE